MPKFYTPYNYDPSLHREPGGGDLLVVPDQALSLREIFERFAQGKPLDNIQRSVLYDEDGDDVSNWDVDPLTVPGVDMVDIDNAKSANAEKITKLRAELRTQTSAEQPT